MDKSNLVQYICAVLVQIESENICLFHVLEMQSEQLEFAKMQPKDDRKHLSNIPTIHVKWVPPTHTEWCSSRLVGHGSNLIQYSISIQISVLNSWHQLLVSSAPRIITWHNVHYYISNPIDMDWYCFRKFASIEFNRCAQCSPQNHTKQNYRLGKRHSRKSEYINWKIERWTADATETTTKRTMRKGFQLEIIDQMQGTEKGEWYELISMWNIIYPRQ